MTTFCDLTSEKAMDDRITPMVRKFSWSMLANGIPPGKFLILAAVSGGKDSVSMLDLLIKTGYVLDLGIAYIDHGLRPEAAKEAAGLAELAKRHRLPFHKRTIDVSGYKNKKSLSVEEAARILRYDALTRIADEHGYRYILVAHTQDDHIETMIMRFLKGSLISGLKGIPSRDDARRIVRPLRDFTSREIHDYIAFCGLSHYHDSTNDDTAYLRNAIRLKIVPQILRSINPGLAKTLERSSRLFGQADSFLDDSAKQLARKIVRSTRESVSIELVGFLEAPTIIKFYLIRNILNEYFGHFEFGYRIQEHIERMIAAPSPHTVIPIGNDLEIVRCYDTLLIRTVRNEEDPEYLIPVELDRPISTPGGKFTIVASRYSDGAIPDFSLPGIYYLDPGPFDLSRTETWLILRSPRTGDRFHPLGSKGQRLLSRIFVDRKIPLNQRSSTPLVLIGNRIALVVGYTIGEHFKLSNRSKDLLKIVVIQR